MDYNNKYFIVGDKETAKAVIDKLFSEGLKWFGSFSESYYEGVSYPMYIAVGYWGIGTVSWCSTPSPYLNRGMELDDISTVLGNVPTFGAYTEENNKEVYVEILEEPTTTWTDKHYSFDVDVSKVDTLKVDPYFVSSTWNLGEKDNSGVLFHILKTIARFGDKNEREREIKAIYAQIKRLAELEGVTL